MEKNRLETGTTTLGIVCKDGIVLAADKRVTLGGMMVSNKKFDKIVNLNDDIAVTTAGSVSDVQLLVKIAKAQIKLNELRKRRSPSVKEAANILANLVYSNVRQFIPGVTGFLLGGRDDSGLYLYELGMDGSIVKYDDYTVDGSGMMFAIGVLETMYKKDLTIDEGIKIAVKAINAAIQRDTASGNGIDVITITKKGAKKVLTKEIEYKLEI